MQVQFNNGRHSSSTNGFIHKMVFGNSTEICKVCDQYSTNVVKKQLRLSVIFLPAHPESCTHIFCFGTHILNLSESQYSQTFSGKFCNGCNDFLAGLTLYSPSESWDA